MCVSLLDEKLKKTGGAQLQLPMLPAGRTCT
jgi:hypothetical protein